MHSPLLWLQFDRDAHRVGSRWLVPCVVVVCLVFLALGMGRLNRHTGLAEADTSAYLNESLAIHEKGGLPAFIGRCVTGRYREANRHPLYLLALSLVAERDVSFFPRAKFVSLFFGLGAVLGTFFAVRWVFGDRIGLIASGLVAVNSHFLRLSSMVACESLLVGLFVAAWAAVAWAFERERERRWLLSGAVTGLAYLAKASGLLVLPAYALSRLIAGRVGVLKKPGFWMFFVAFAGVASPLLLRNARRFGNPFHNVNNATMWLDDWEDVYKPEFKRNPPTMSGYFKSHTLRRATRRMLWGMRHEAETFQTRCLRPIGIPRGAVPGVTFVILVSGLLAMATDPLRGRRGFSLSCLLLFYLAFSWYFRVVPASRFMLPMVPMFYAYAAIAALGAGARLGHVPRLRWLGAVFRKGGSEALFLVCGVAILGWSLGFSPDLRRNPLRSYRTDPGEERLRAWLEANVRPGRTYWQGPSHSYDFVWRARIPGTRRDIPLVRDIDELDRLARVDGVKHIVLDWQAHLRRKHILARCIEYRVGEGFVVRRLPHGWRVALADPDPPADYLVIEVGPRP